MSPCLTSPQTCRPSLKDGYRTRHNPCRFLLLIGLLCGLLTQLGNQEVFAAGTNLDPSFGTGGRVVTSVSGSEAHEAMLQPDGKNCCSRNRTQPNYACPLQFRRQFRLNLLG